MVRQRREAQDKKEQREGKRRLEEELWAPPKDCTRFPCLFFAGVLTFIKVLAPELVELWNQSVVYPVKACEAAWRKELDKRMLL